MSQDTNDIVAKIRIETTSSDNFPILIPHLQNVFTFYSKPDSDSDDLLFESTFVPIGGNARPLLEMKQNASPFPLYLVPLALTPILKMK